MARMSTFSLCILSIAAAVHSQTDDLTAVDLNAVSLSWVCDTAAASCALPHEGKRGSQGL